MNRIGLSLAAGATAVALAVSGCSSSSSGNGRQAGSTSNTPSPSASSSTDFPSTSASSSSSSASAPSGGSSEVPQARLDEIKAALKSAPAVRVAGTSAQDNTTVQVDLHFGASSASGSIVASGQRIELLGAGGIDYFRASDAFWQAELGANAATVLPLISGKWVKVPADNANFKDFDSFLDKATFADELVSPDGPVEAVPGKTINGVETTGLKDTSDGSVLYVAASGQPRPIEITDGTSKIDFSDYDTPFTAAAPAASQVFDLTPYVK